MTTLNIKNVNKADVLAALYNNSKVQGMGFLQANSDPMTKNDAQKLLDSGVTYFDYLHGKVMKIDISGDELSTGLYDRDNGHGAAENALSGLLT